MNVSCASPRVLVADDQPDVREALRLLLKAEGYSTEAVDNPNAIVKAVEGQDFDLLLMDLNYARDTTSGREGLDLLERLQNVDDTLPVVVMTAWGSVELTVEAMRSGARDFVQKPWDSARLLSILRTQIELGQALRRGDRLQRENELLQQDSPKLVADSAAMKPVLELIERVGPSDANVLITGENGTGKGVVARQLHASSRRASRAMITVNVGGLSEGVFESELFGHVKGAYTDAKADRVGRFELADRGTLFLDEIANVPHSQQRKLLRVLETGDFERVGSSKTKRADVRIRPPSRTSVKTWARDAFARICYFGSIRSRSICRRFAIDARTSSLSRPGFSIITRGTTARISEASTTKRSRHSRIFPGPATSESSTTRSSGPC